MITPALMTGAFADRFRFKPYLIFILLWLLLVYCPWCHWLWGQGFLAAWGARDLRGRHRGCTSPRASGHLRASSW